MTVRVVVIGAGPGGYAAALSAARGGGNVTLIEKQHIGGTCLNWGCIPSKIMQHTAKLYHNMQYSKRFGIDCISPPIINMKTVLQRKQRVIDTLQKGMLQSLTQAGIRVLNGDGSIRSSGRITVTHSDCTQTKIAYDKLILATGSETLDLPILPVDGQRVLSSKEALNLTALPASMLIVGGGVIGCEFASIFAALGVRVTLVEALDRLLPLPNVEDTISKTLLREMKKRRITVLTRHNIISAQQNADHIRVTIAPSSSPESSANKKLTPQTLDIETVIVCIGRKPNTAGIAFEALGIETDPQGWVVTGNDLRTSCPDVFAIGDMLGPSKIMLAHMAAAEGHVAAANAMGENREISYANVPSAIFTLPEVAGVGLTQKQAVEQKMAVKSSSALFRTLGKAHAIDDIGGQATLISDAQTASLLGVHIIGPHATDLIAEGVLALEKDATLNDIAETIHAHPTLAEILQEAAMPDSKKI